MNILSPISSRVAASMPGVSIAKLFRCFFILILSFLILPLSLTQVSDAAPTWENLTPTGGPPAARVRHTSVYDPNTNQMIVYGGDNNSCCGTWPIFTDVSVLGNANGLDATPPSWTHLSPTGGPPTQRWGHTSVYDPGTGRMIVYGGDSNVGYCEGLLGDVWVLQNANGAGTPNWMQLFPTGAAPPPLRGHNAVYDTSSNRMILFGGNPSSCVPPPPITDVWVLENANGVGVPNWIHLSPTGTPPLPSEHTADYDQASNRLIVQQHCCNSAFPKISVLENANGLDNNRNPVVPHWTQLTFTSPLPASQFPYRFPSSIFNPATNQVVLFGGDVAAGLSNDVWTLSNATGLGGTPNWVLLSPSGEPPPARDNHSAVFDQSSQRMTVFGGRINPGSGNVVTNDTWVLSTSSSINDGLVAHYPFEGNANDVSGQGNNGIENGGLTYVNGIVGQAASFDGINDFVEVPHDNSLNVNGDSITLSVWIKTSMTPSWGGHIVSKGIDWHWQYSMWVNSSGKAYAIAHYNAGGNYWLTESSIPVNDGQWHHIVGILTDWGSYIYVDGLLSGTDTVPQWSWNKVDVYPLSIGRMSREPYIPPTNYFSGLIDDIRIYNRALSQAEVQALYSSAPQNGPPVADAGAGQTIECTGASSANATLDGSASTDPDAADILSYSWSWAGGSATGVSPTASFPLGTTAVTLAVDDGNGGIATATTEVTVEDTIAPTVNAGSDVTALEATNTSGANFDVSTQASASDTCCAVNVNTSPAGVYPLGNTSVSVSATDCANNSASDTMVVTVVDTTAPILTQPADILSIEASSGAGVVVTFALPAATDAADATPSVSCTPASGSTFALGNTPVTCTATDASNNSSSVSFTVNVVDTTAPVVTPPADVPVEATGPLTSVTLGSASASDLVDGTLTATPDQIGPFTVGTYTITWSATDAAGNTGTATQSVTVNEVTIVPNQPLPNGGTVSISVSPGQTLFNVSIQNISMGLPPGMVLWPIGSSPYLMTYSVTSPQGGDATIFFNFSSQLPPIVVLKWTGSGVSLLPWSQVDANTIAITLTDGGPFDLDGVANGIIVDPIAIAVDIEAPVITLNGANPVTVDKGSTYADAGATAIDNVDGDLTIAIVVNNPVDTNTVGTYTVTYSVADSSDNTAQATRTVIVQATAPPADTTPPAVTVELVPVEMKKHKGKFRVEFSAIDAVDPNPAIVATLNGVPVTNGQIVELKHKKKEKIKEKNGKLKIKGMSFTLDVTATDASGNTGTASDAYAFPSHKDDDHGIHRGNDKEDRHADSGNHKSEGKDKVEHKKKSKKHDKDD